MRQICPAFFPSLNTSWLFQSDQPPTLPEQEKKTYSGRTQLASEHENSRDNHSFTIDWSLIFVQPRSILNPSNRRARRWDSAEWQQSIRGGMTNKTRWQMIKKKPWQACVPASQAVFRASWSSFSPRRGVICDGTVRRWGSCQKRQICSRTSHSHRQSVWRISATKRSSLEPFPKGREADFRFRSFFLCSVFPLLLEPVFMFFGYGRQKIWWQQHGPSGGTFVSLINFWWTFIIVFVGPLGVLRLIALALRLSCAHGWNKKFILWLSRNWYLSNTCNWKINQLPLLRIGCIPRGFWVIEKWSMFPNWWFHKFSSNSWGEDGKRCRRY